MYIYLNYLLDILPEDLIISYFDDYRVIDGYLWRGRNNTKKAIIKEFGLQTLEHPLSNVKKGRFEPDAIYLYDQSSLFVSDWHVRKIDFRKFCEEMNVKVYFEELTDSDYWLYEMTDEEQKKIKLFFECFE